MEHGRIATSDTEPPVARHPRPREHESLGVDDLELMIDLKSRTPRRFSRLATALPIAVADTSRSKAAARKLPCLAMATTASSSINPLLYIVTILWLRHRSLSRLSPRSKSVMVQPYSMTQGG